MAGATQGALAARLVLESGQFKAEMGATASLSERELRRIQKQVQFVNDYIRETARVQKTVTETSAQAARSLNTMTISAAQQANAMRMVPAQITDIVTQLQGGQNPLTILIQQGGQMRDMFGGFGNMFRSLAGMITPVGAAVAGVGAAVGILGYAYYQGSEESKNFAKSFSLTGGYAGITESKYRSLAVTLANTVGTTVGSIKEIEDAAINTGRVGPQNFGAFVLAAAKMQKATGQTAEQVVADLARMTESTTQWATTSNQQYHFLTAAQIEHIRKLEEQGDKEMAVAAVLDALNAHVRTSASWWDQLKTSASEAWDAMTGSGKEKTIADQIAEIDRKLAAKRNQGDSGNPERTQVRGVLVDPESPSALRAQRQVLVQKQLQEQLDATTKADNARAQAAGANANQTINAWLKQAKAGSAYKQQVEAITQAFKASDDAAKRSGNASPFSDKDRAAIEAYFKKQYTPASATKMASEVETLSKDLDNQAVKLKAQAEYWAKYGKSLDDSSAAVMRFRTSQGDLKSLPSDQKAMLNAKADALDAAKRQEQANKETAQAGERVASLEAESQAREQSARSLYIEQKAREALGQSIDADLRKRAEKAAADMYDRQQADLLTKSLGASSVQIDKEVASIDAEISMIGQSASARQHAADMIRVQASAQQLLAKHTEKQAEIDAWATLQVQKLTEARERQVQADRLASNGVASALATYKDNASSTAKLVDQAVTNGLSSMEDALTTFATTGKLSFKSFADSVVADITRIIIKQQIMNALGMGSGGSSINGWLSTAATALFGGGSAPASAPGFASAAGINGGRASGGPVMAGGMYRVNETGAPEMLESNGQSYLLTGGRDGRVTPASQVQAGHNFTQHLHITVAGNADARSAQQIAAASGRAAQRALARNS